MRPIGQPGSSQQISAGVPVSHPASTNFYSDDEQPTTAKRLKSTNTTDGDSPQYEAWSADYPQAASLPPSPEAHDVGEVDTGETKVLKPSTLTDLEVALPSVRSDREAIEEYEAYKAAQKTGDSTNTNCYPEDELWERGRSSIYVDAFNLCLDTVLEHEAHLFDEKEKAIFASWRSLDYQSQYLYVRLFLRKTHAWHRVSRLGYHADIANLDAAVAELQKCRHLFATRRTPQDVLEVAGETAVPNDSDFAFAESSDEHINTLDEASSLLLLDELKAVAREAKVQGKNKQELLSAFRSSSGRQSGLDFHTLPTLNTEDSAASAEEMTLKGMEDNNTQGSSRRNRDAHYTQKILHHTGECIRLSEDSVKLFERVHLVFYRSTEWTEKSLTTTILAKISRRNFPNYIVSRSANVFVDRALLLEFESSLRLQFKVDNILEFNGTTGQAGFEEVQSIFEEVYPRWQALLAEEQVKEDRLYDEGEGAYLRRFNPAWVYTRIVHKGLLPLARFKNHAREHEVLTNLLQQRLFHPARRGAWYQRKALIEEHYMHALTSTDGRSAEGQRQHWKKVALRTCEQGLEDRDCHLIYHYDLQKRIRKLEKTLKVPVRRQHDFGPFALAKPVECTVRGVQIDKESHRARQKQQQYRPTRDIRQRHSSASRSPAPESKGGRTTPTLRRRLSSGGGERGSSGKTVWLDQYEDNAECSVESMCLSHYRHAPRSEGGGWKGYHSESGVLRTLFAFLFHSILFTYVPNVFQTPFQIAPLDLFTDAFYPTRFSEIHERLAEISNGAAEDIFISVWRENFERRTCVVGLNWEYERDDLIEIIRCFEPDQLATLCRLMAQEYQLRGSGVPDLFLWRIDDPDEIGDGTNDRYKSADHTQTAAAAAAITSGSNSSSSNSLKGQILFSEVKSPHDRLSDTQRLWIHVLLSAGIRVELCHAVPAPVPVPVPVAE